MEMFCSRHTFLWPYVDLYRPQRGLGKVIFSETCVKNSVHGGGACMAGGMHGGCVWVRGMCGRGGHVWQGACVAGGHAW